MRTDLHGLSVLSIFFLLNYQLWRYYAFHGQFGLDVIFVIVGYETSRLLSEQKTKSGKRERFFAIIRYFLPTYLLICFFIVILGFCLMAPIDYPQLLHEAKLSVGFVSNFNFNFNTTFPLVVGFYPCSHMWAISLLVQYTTLLTAFVVLKPISHVKVLSVVAVIALISFTIWSFYSRWLPTSLQERLWQPLIGFIVRQFEYSEPTNQDETTKLGNRPKDSLVRDDRRSFHRKSTLMTIILIVLYVCPFGWTPTFDRLLFTSFAVAVIVIGRDKPCILLNNRIFKSLTPTADILYLLFLPIVRLYKHVFEVRTFVPKIHGLLILTLTFGLAYSIHWLRTKMTRKIDQWWKLLTLVAVGYVLTFLLFGFVSSYSPVSYDTPLTYSQRQEAGDLMNRFVTHEDTENLTTWSIMHNNLLVATYTEHKQFCSENKALEFTDRYNVQFDFVCVDKGKGQKTFLVIGDEYSAPLFHGIRFHFGAIYSELHVLSLAYDCDLSTLKTNHSYECVSFEQKTRRILEQWSQEVDLLVLVYRYPDASNKPFVDGIQDELFVELNEFYRFLNAKIRDRIFIPQIQLTFNLPPDVFYVQKRLFYNLDLTFFQTTINDHNERFKHVRRRLKTLDCSTCTIVDMGRVFCSELRRTCRAVDEKRQLLYFQNDHQLNAYGSLFYAKYLKTLYEDGSRKQIPFT